MMMLTFKSLDGEPLVFTTDVRPFKRCLAYQVTRRNQYHVDEPYSTMSVYLYLPLASQS